jgi:hypothetical protein
VRYVIETFRFRSEGRPRGWYVVSPVSVEVDGIRYSSQPLSFEILGANESGELRLQALVEGPSPLYPGQRVRFIYRIHYAVPVEHSSEILPLLDARGFRLVGSKQVRSFKRGGVQVVEVGQEVQALRPGRYRFGPSSIEGFAYKESFFGRRQYIQPRLRAEADEVQVEVKAFPQQGQPKSFNGALGNFDMKARLLSPDTVRVGDKMELELRFSGSGEWETVLLPSLQSIPGLSKAFRVGDLPPVGRVEGNEKVFVIELRPLRSGSSEIPAISYAFFDPIREEYVSLTSDPISIKVEASKVIQGDPRPSQTGLGVQEERSYREEVLDIGRGTALIPISGNIPLQIEDLKPSFWHGLRTRDLLLVTLLFFLLNGICRFLWMRRQHVRPPSAKDYLALARKWSRHREPCLDHLGRALRMYLQQEVLEHDKEQRVRSLLEKVDHARYAGIQEQEPWKPLLEEALKIGDWK